MLRTTIELTIEEIELLLDLIGPPDPTEHRRKSELRQRLQEILLSLRQRQGGTENAA
jgi:hypothetical protein